MKILFDYFIFPGFLFAAAVGFLTLQFVLGPNWIHPFGMAAVSYVLLALLPPVCESIPARSITEPIREMTEGG